MNVQIKESSEIMGSWKYIFIVENYSLILCFWSAKQVLEMTGSYIKFFNNQNLWHTTDIHFPLDYLS